MRRRYLAPFVILAAFIAFIPLDAAPPPRIAAVGDVHGAAEAFASILQQAGLIDGQRQWTGGTAVLVQTGDLVARGSGERAVLDLLMALEPQAAAAGGRVQVLLGNHEVITVMGETRDTAPDIFRLFADDQSEVRREQAFQSVTKISKGRSIDKAAWLAAHPLGFVEYRDAFGPNGVYGKWLRSKPILTEIDGTVFMHGGINPAFTTDSLDSITRRARQELSEWDQGVRWLAQRNLALPFSTFAEVMEAAQAEYGRIAAQSKSGPISEADGNAARMITPLVNVGASSLLHPDGPMWFRGYSTWTDEEGAPKMAALLKKYHVKRFVTAHTPQPSGRIKERFGGALYLIDTGMLNGKWYPTGRPSALQIAGDTVTQIYVE